MRTGLMIALMLILVVWRAQAHEPAAVSTASLPLVVRAAPDDIAGSVTPRPACDPSYPDVCIPPPPPDLDCTRIIYRNFIVLPPDPHGFDRDHDGIGCEDGEGSTPTYTPTSTLTSTPTVTSTPTSTPTLTPTSTSNAVVVYRVEGAASKVVVSYLDETGKENTVEVTLPWRIQFNTALDADLAVDAFSVYNEVVPLTCAIEINGTILLTDRTENAVNGVACERFIN